MLSVTKTSLSSHLNCLDASYLHLPGCNESEVALDKVNDWLALHSAYAQTYQLNPSSPEVFKLESILNKIYQLHFTCNDYRLSDRILP
jgi:hypothetical protein